MNNLLEQVKKTIQKHGLIESGDSVLVGLSGGADSVCLLSCLLELSDELMISVSAAHVNHCLRGEAADNDQRFSEELCEKWNVPFYAVRKDIKALSLEKSVGLEEAGRMARYDFFFDLQKQFGFTKIATAHHGNDNIETVLMRLLRGTGPLGLSGIPYRNGDIIRPLLDTNRSAIELYLKNKAIGFRTDVSNLDSVYTRNKIRNQLIPQLEQDFNPNFQSTFQEEIRLYQSCASYIKDEARKVREEKSYAILGGYAVPCDALLGLHEFLASTVIHQMIEKLSPKKEVSHLHISKVLSILQECSGRVNLPDGIIAEVCYRILYLRRNPEFDFEEIELKPGVTVILHDGKKLSCSVVYNSSKKSNRSRVLLDMDQILGKKITLRPRRNGDYFYPVGMDGRKKLQDYFVDEKVPYFMRDFVPLVTVGDDIALVVGFRADRRFTSSNKEGSYFCVTED